MCIAIYFRCSTIKQSIAHQRHAVQNWIKQQGYDPSTVSEYADEGISGSKDASIRLGFGELVKEIKAKKVEKVILFEMSRASRDFLQFLQFMELCSKNRCQIEVVGEGELHFETSTDKLNGAVQAFLAEAEKEKIRMRTKSGLVKAKARGVKLGAPKGHKRNTGRRKEHNPELVDDIRRYTEKNLSIREIAEIIRDRYTAKPICYATVRNLQKKYGIRKPCKESGTTAGP